MWTTTKYQVTFLSQCTTNTGFRDDVCLLCSASHPNKKIRENGGGGVSNNMFVWRSKLITVWMSHSSCYSLLEPQRGSLLYCEYMNTDVWLSARFSLDPECISADCKHARSCVSAKTYRNYEGQNLKCAATPIPPDTIQPHSHN